MNKMTVGSMAQTMTSMEIAELTGKRHDHVMRDIRVMLEDIGSDLPSFGGVYVGGNGQTQPCFHLPHDETICLLTGYDAKARMAVIKRWQELEALASFAIPTTLSGALRLAAEQAETIEAQAIALQAAAPALEFVENYVHSSSGSMSFRRVCKLLEVKEQVFRAFLVAEKIMYWLGGDWAPYAQHIDAGRFEVTTGTAHEHVFAQSKFTAKGVSWVAGEYAKFKIKEGA